MRLVVGLGNPGPEYRDTRHNLGFRVVEEIAARRRIPLDRSVCAALVGRADDLVLAEPITWMNRSGLAVRGLVERETVEPGGLLVVLDDVALPLGRLRLRPGGGPGGHRGLASVIESLQTSAIARLRLGIAPACDGGAGRSDDDLAAFVLAPFTAEERPVVAAMVTRGADAVEAWLAEDIDSVMGRFNA